LCYIAMKEGESLVFGSLCSDQLLIIIAVVPDQASNIVHHIPEEFHSTAQLMMVDVFPCFHFELQSSELELGFTFHFLAVSVQLVLSIWAIHMSVADLLLMDTVSTIRGTRIETTS